MLLIATRYVWEARAVDKEGMRLRFEKEWYLFEIVEKRWVVIRLIN